MKYLIPLAFLLASCSQSFHCKKCTSGSNVIRDTLLLRDTIVTASIKVDTVVSYDLSTDTLVIHKDRLTIKYRDLPGPTIYIAGECDSVVKIKEIKVPVETEVHTGFTFWQILLACLATMGVTALLFLLKR